MMKTCDWGRYQFGGLDLALSPMLANPVEARIGTDLRGLSCPRPAYIDKLVVAINVALLASNGIPATGAFVVLTGDPGTRAATTVIHAWDSGRSAGYRPDWSQSGREMVPEPALHWNAVMFSSSL